MEPDIGAPAFDSIDDVLAERIVNHSRTHSDRTGPEPENGTPPASPTKTDCGTAPENTGVPGWMLITGLMTVVLIMLLYRFTHRSSQR